MSSVEWISARDRLPEVDRHYKRDSRSVTKVSRSVLVLWRGDILTARLEDVLSIASGELKLRRWDMRGMGVGVDAVEWWAELPDLPEEVRLGQV